MLNHHVPIKWRLRLFDATVSASVLYGSSCWTMTSDREQRLRTAQRRMLRLTVGSRRVPKTATATRSDSSSDTTTSVEEIGSEEEDEQVLVGETWVEWLIRTTSIAEDALKRARIPDWITEQRRRLWRFAGHTARRQDGRWNRLLLEWKPRRACRLPWRPTTRWSDQIDKYRSVHKVEAGGWIGCAQDRRRWEQCEAEFVLRRF